MLEEENITLQERLKRMEAEDERKRGVFSDLLDNVEYIDDSSFGYAPRHGVGKRKVITAQWEEIFFMMGELKADANYSLCLQREQDARMEATKWKAELGRVELEMKDNKNKNV